jgi:hypothetical protein
VEDKNRINTAFSAASPALGASSYNAGALSLQPTPLSSAPAPVQPKSIPTNQVESTGFGHFMKRFAIVVILLFVLGVGGVLVVGWISGNKEAGTTNVAGEFSDTEIPLADLPTDENLESLGSRSLTINGPLKVNDTFVLAPQAQPVDATAGQLYFDQTNSTLTYYDGTKFVALQGDNVVSVTSGSPNVTVTNDGTGNLVIAATGGAGTVTSGGGTAGRIAKFTGAQNIENSLLSEAGTVITVNGDLSVTGSVGLANALTVSNGGTGAAALTANGVIIGNGTAALTSVIAGGVGQCLVSTAGAPAFQACPGGGGTFFEQGGNSFGAPTVLGTNDANSLAFETSGVTQATIAVGGATTFQNSANSTTAFQVLNAAAVPQFVVDTSGSRVYIGNPTGDTTAALFVLDTKTDPGDPTGVAGGVYYNSNAGKFRCFIAAWADCMTPGGATTQLQFNDGGSFGGDADLVWDKTTNAMTLGGTDTGIVLVGATNEPSATTSGQLRFYAKSVAGRMLFKFRGPIGTDKAFQPSFFSGAPRYVLPQSDSGNSEAGLGSQMNCTGPQVNTIPAAASTNLRTSSKRLELASVAGANSAACLRGPSTNSLYFWRGNAAGLGGFFSSHRFAVSTTTANQQLFIGLWDRTTNPAGTQVPSNQTNIIGAGWDSADTNLQIMHNDSGGTATKVDLGASFPANNTTAIYDMKLYAEPNGSNVLYEVTRLDTGTVTTGTLSTNLPSNTTFLTYGMYINNGGTAASAAMDFFHFYIETDY